ncbi:unnamed protein product [Adineta steineri]|uniref:Fucosyltransferase n=1 Tax=Adineta steineri TaxID=433720 RepID=A0A815BIC6_9BILA|nr:unnamed protein product [Adineta steineri]
MNKRIHTKRSTNLTWRQYFLHFKWPVIGFIFFFIFLSLNPLNLNSYIYSSIDDYPSNFEILFTNVIYPIDILKKTNRNTSILYYFKKKDELKAIDDIKAIEKFWRTLSVGAIPIVSGPKRENFARIVPPQSFIHVDDYTSDKDLADALNLIGKNRTLYGKYHAWRQYYDVYYEAKDVDPYRFCELCYRLNTNKQRIWYENINEWFLEKC